MKINNITAGQIVFHFRIVLFISITIALSAIEISCNRNVGSNKKEETAHKEWLSLINNFPPREGAIELSYQSSFPSSHQEKAGIYLQTPFYLTWDHQNNILISDTKANSIKKYDQTGQFIEKIGKAGQAPGELLGPRFIEIDNNNNIYVLESGNMRIQILNSLGESLNTFKVFKPYSSMALSRDGLIILSPQTSNTEEPLIEVLNSSGITLKYLGRRNEFAQNSPIHNDVHIAINNNNDIVVAWKYFPIIKIFSLDGQLVSSFTVDYALLKKLAEPNYNLKSHGGSIRMRNVISGIIAKKDKLYLFISYPQYELLELDFHGTLAKIYWINRPYKQTTTDFLISEDSKENIVMLLVSIVNPVAKIKAYSFK